MNALKKKYGLCLVLNFLTLGLFTFYIAYKLDLYDKNAWYCKWYYWTLGFICGIFPALIMFLVFLIEVGCMVSYKFDVPGKDIYMLPYPWIVCLIVPIFGWTLFIILYLYTHFWYLFSVNK